MPEIVAGLEHVWYARTEAGWRAIVGAHPFRVKGWPELDLCIHHERAYLDRRAQWVITEGHTGRRIVRGYSRAEAESDLLIVLGRQSKADLLAKIEQDSAGEGLSPRWREERE